MACKVIEIVLTGYTAEFSTGLEKIDTVTVPPRVLHCLFILKEKVRMVPKNNTDICQE